MAAVQEETTPRRGRRWLYLLPVGLFVVVVAALGWGLGRDSSVLPSALVGRPAPDFALPPIPGRDAHGFSRADLGRGRPVLVNVWASWCVPCRAENPVLLRLAREEGVTIHGINYKDKVEDARRFLASLGDPFTLIGRDADGRAGIEWGVYGVPETFVVDGRGIVRYRHVGPLLPHDVDGKILPLLRELEAEAGS